MFIFRFCWFVVTGVFKVLTIFFLAIVVLNYTDTSFSDIKAHASALTEHAEKVDLRGLTRSMKLRVAYYLLESEEQPRRF